MRCEPLEQRQLLAITVETLTPTASGFVVEFSDQIQTSSLNLYDAENEALGQADVTLRGATYGAVPGSLMIEGKELTFVATGGPLAADTYTVTLRSTSDAIVDEALGQLLDGEYSTALPSGDGTAGGDFVYSFSVGTPEQLVVSLSDFARGPGQAVEAPAAGSSEELPDGLLLQFSDAEGVTSGSLKIAYNPDLLTITAVGASPDAPSDMLVEANLTQSGVAVISFAIPGDPLESGAANLIEIIAEVPGDAPYGAVQVLDISEVEINAGAIEATADDAVHAVVFVGDANGNCVYDTEDARLIARVGMGLDSGFAVDQPCLPLSDDYEVLFPTIDPEILGDVTGKEGLSALDASDILRCVTGLETPNIPAIPDLVAPTASITPNGTNVSSDTILFTITFDEEVDGVDMGDLSAVGSLGSELTLSDFTAVSTTEYTVEVTGMSRSEKLTLTLAASGSGIEDTAGNSLADSTTATVTYVKNSAPTAAGDSASTNENATIVIDVLENDEDSDLSDTLTVNSVNATSGKGATITVNSDSTLTYNATSSETLNALAEDESATDTFEYAVSDGQGGTDTATVTVTVAGRNDVPSANSDTATTDLTEAVDIDVLANDTDPDTSDVLSIDSFEATSEQGAAITLNADGTLHYDPAASDTLAALETATTDSFTYTLTDGHSGVAVTGTVTVTLNGSTSSDVTYIDLQGDSIDVDGSGATVDGCVVTITSAGTYSISGTLNDGQVIVDTDDVDPVTLLLSGADITCSSSAPIYVVSAEDAVITLADDTENYITDGSAYTYETGTDEPDAAIFSDDDLTINGNGSLTVDANYNDGITSKDDLDITGGNITVSSVGDGIKGKDSLEIEDGTLTVNAGNDGLKSTNDEDATQGYVEIKGGTVNITAAADGIQAETAVLISGGTIDITTGGGSSKAVNSTDSAKAIKANVDVTIQGGTITIDSADDAIHSNDSITISSGTITVTSGDDGIHADSSITINGGDIVLSKCYEGIESAAVTINDGNIHLVSSDDGINIAGGVDGSSPNGFNSSSDNYLAINGGYIVVNAVGDGIDVNGSVTMTAGTLIVHGPIANMNGPVDYDGTFVMSGGYLVAVGSSGMAQAPSSSSTQESLSLTYKSAQSAGTMVHIETEDGEEILTFVPEKAYQSVVLCSPDLEAGTTYIVYYGGSSTGTVKDGLYSGGTYTAGTKAGSITLS